MGFNRFGSAFANRLTINTHDPISSRSRFSRSFGHREILNRDGVAKTTKD